MADLNNLLAELDEAEAIFDHEEGEEENNNIADPQNNNELIQEPDNHDDVEPEVPPILAAAVLAKADEKQDDVDGDEEGDYFTLDEDYTRLRSMWVRELLSPELMPHQDTTVSLELELLSGQEESIEKYSLQQQQQSTNKNHNELALLEDITKLDSARVKFVLEDFVTTRLDKIEDHALYNREMVDRMTEQEINYLKSYGELLEKHFNRTVLDHMPPKDAWKKLDEPHMIDSPDMNQFVFCRVLDDKGVEIVNTVKGGDDTTTNSTMTQQHDCGSCLIVRYGAIQSLIIEEKVELLM